MNNLQPLKSLLSNIKRAPAAITSALNIVTPRLLLVSVLRGKPILLDYDIHRPKVGFDAALTIGLPMARVDNHVGTLNVREVQSIDGLLIQPGGLIPTSDQENVGREVVETDSHLNLVQRGLALVTRLESSNIPAIVNQLLGHFLILDDDTEVSITFAVILALFPGKVREQQTSVLNFERGKSVRHVSCLLSKNINWFGLRLADGAGFDRHMVARE